MFESRRRVSVRSILAVTVPLLAVCLNPLVGLSAPQSASPAQPGELRDVPAKPVSGTAQEETEALRHAIQSAAGNPEALIKNLEDFLRQFPQTARREQVLRTIYRQAVQANDSEKAAVYAERLLDLNAADAELLSALVDLTERSTDTARREKALQYATRFVEGAEKMARESPETGVPAERWFETQTLMRASGHLLRGRLYAKSGQIDKAIADFEQSFEAYPSVQAAERLGDLAAEKGDMDRAIDTYARAFAFPDRTTDPARKDQIRKKLGSAYLAKNHSEKGLGDLVLSRYDELMRTLGSRLPTKTTPNAGLRDAYDYALSRLDGSTLRLKELQGKVVVMEFWATWCGPCRAEGRLFERVRDSFRSEPAAVFLAVDVDEDRERVPDFIQQERWTVPVVYAEGLDSLLSVHALPTLVIFSREGRVVFRQEGLNAPSFVETVTQKVREALAPSTVGPKAPVHQPGS